MNTDPVIVREVRWTKLFPVLHLFRAFGLPFRLRILLPALVCVFAANLIFDSSSLPAVRLVDFKWKTGNLFVDLWIAAFHHSTGIPRVLLNCISPEMEWWQYPVAVLVTGVAAVATGSAAAGQFCRDQRIGPIAGLSNGVTRVPNWIVAALLAALIAGIPIGFLSLLRWVSYGPGIVGQALWPVAWVAALCLIPLVWVLLAGLLLAAGAIATDRCDGAEALSRGINYVLSHFVRSIGYGLVIILVSSSAKAVAGELTEFAQHLLGQFVIDPTASGGRIRVVVDDLFACLPEAVGLGSFFSGTTLGYILLRHREDAVSFNEMSPPVKSASQEPS